MPCDFFVYDTVQEYLRHYKHEITEKDRHIEIDSFYIFPNKQLWIVLKNNDLPIRPEFDRTIVYINYDKLKTYLKNSPDENPIIINSKEAYYDPNNSKVLFLRTKRSFFFKKYNFIAPVHRFFGRQPNKIKRINWYAFYDHLKKRVSFVLDNNSPSLD